MQISIALFICNKMKSQGKNKNKVHNAQVAYECSPPPFALSVLRDAKEKREKKIGRGGRILGILREPFFLAIYLLPHLTD